ncbi:MAG: Poly(3-hydroxyalkanoate) polymerase subunit PhaE [Dehalococcoidia bacterium]|nr:Poly(3-hydroxyalkanoate) polymerase subunit PhaE [Chloroflexota bacterium]
METERKWGTDFSEAWLGAQANLMQSWADAWLGFSKATEGAERAKESTRPWGTTGDIYNQWLNMCQEMFGEYWKGAPLGIDEQTFEKTPWGAQTYARLYEFWANAAKILSGTSPGGKGIPESYQEFCDFWLENYNELLRGFFTFPHLEPLRGLLGSAAELSQMYADVLSKFSGPWMEAMQGLPEKTAEALRKGPQGYADVHRWWLQAYEQTWGRVLRMTPLGLTRETSEMLQRGTESLIEHYAAMTDYSSAFYRVGTEAMQKVATKLGDMYNKGQAPKTYKEFYTLWWTTNEEALYELFKSPEFSRLLGRVVDATMRVRKRYDDIMEEYLKALPVPTRSEMNDLYKTLYLLKKEVRENTKQVRELEEKLRTTETALGKEESLKKEVRENTKQVRELEEKLRTTETALGKEES